MHSLKHYSQLVLGVSSFNQLSSDGPSSKEAMAIHSISRATFLHLKRSECLELFVILVLASSFSKLGLECPYFGFGVANQHLLGLL